MELSHLILDAVWRPSFLVKNRQLQAHLDNTIPRVDSQPWEDSCLNPKNRVDSLDITSCRWRVDGATICGTCIYVVPLDLLPNLPPLRIFLYLPDQTYYPPSLRQTLDATESVILRDGRAIANLGIAKHVCHALDYHCSKHPDFYQRYLRLPFGSALHFEHITPDISDMALDIVPNYEVESKTVTVQSLLQQWTDVPKGAWPPVVDICSLSLKQQLNETVSIVFPASSADPRTVIFKSGLASMDHIYHELHFLLTIPPHAHIMPPPLAIVTKKVAFGGKHGVVGFLLPLFSPGSIRDILPARHRTGSLPNSLKLRWCRQVTSALIWVHEQAGTFYSDLRPDNVLLDDSTPGREDVILCDFEQRGNWHEWCAPEIRYRQYAENIRAALPARVKNNTFRRLLDGYTQMSPPVQSPCYTSAESSVQASNRPWFALPSEVQEKAMVYSLGLFIYTVFEGLSNVRRSLACKWPNEPDIDFPQFRATPHPLRRVIRACTVDAPEWEMVGQSQSQSGKEASPRASGFVRVGGMLYPTGGSDFDLESGERRDIVFDRIFEYWKAEIERAEMFLERSDWQAGDCGRERPHLREVLEALDNVTEEAISA